MERYKLTMYVESEFPPDSWDLEQHIPGTITEYRANWLSRPPQSSPPPSAEAEVEELYRAVDKLRMDLYQMLNAPADNVAVQKKNGILIHGKVERATQEAVDLQAKGADTTKVMALIAEVSRACLKHVFGIET